MQGTIFSMLYIPKYGKNGKGILIRLLIEHFYCPMFSIGYLRINQQDMQQQSFCLCLIGQFDQMVERGSRRSPEVIVLGTKTVQFIGNIECRKDSYFVAIGGPGPLLHFLHSRINERRQLLDMRPVVPRLDAVGLAEYLYLDTFQIVTM